MTEQLIVTPAQRRAARYIVRRNAAQGRPTSDAVLRMANAEVYRRPVSGSGRATAQPAGTA